MKRGKEISGGMEKGMAVLLKELMRKEFRILKEKN